MDSTEIKRTFVNESESLLKNYYHSDSEFVIPSSLLSLPSASTITKWSASLASELITYSYVLLLSKMMVIH